MNSDEKLADSFIRSQGYIHVQFEPDGKVPPDFLIDKTIAVEVRRLNHNVFVKGKMLGLETEDAALGCVVREVFEELGVGPPGRQPHYVNYRFQRPIGKYKDIKKELRTFLNSVRENGSTPGEQQVGSGLWVTIIKASHTASNQFRPAIIVDDDSGGMVLELLRQNIEHCVAEKTNKVAPYHSKYPTWWLALIDHVAFGMDAFDAAQFKQNIRISHTFDRLVLVNPQNPSDFVDV